MHPSDPGNEPASSPCQLDTTDPVYHGFLPRADLLALLNTLLSAERAGAKICTLTLRQPDAQPWAAFLQQVRQDEVASCQGLLRSIALLGGQANREVGEFFGKCMALSAIEARLQLLDRGQQWVVRKITDALPKINHAGVRAQLAEMLRVHVANSDRFRQAGP